MPDPEVMHRARVIVEPPDSRGLRQVRVGGEVVGAAWSRRGLRKILVREGFPKDVYLNDRALISWRGVGSDYWPDRALRRYLTAAFMAAGLIGSAGFLIFAGSKDAFGALTFASRVTGFSLFVAGLTQLVAALAVKDYWGKRTVKYSGLLVAIGVFIALLVHTMFVVLWLQEREFTPWVFTYMPLAVWSLGATWIVVRERAWRGIPHPKQVTAGVLATALLAASNFAYSAAYQPYATDMQLAFTTKVGKPELDRHEPVLQIPVKFSLQNVGKVPAHVIASSFWVYGKTSKFSTAEQELEGVRHDAELNADSERYAGSPEWDLIMTGLIIDPGDWFPPGEGQAEDVMVQVPTAVTYESIEVEALITVLRKDRGKVDVESLYYPLYSWEKGQTEVFDCPRDCGDYVLYMGKMVNNNNMINITRRQRHVVAVRYLDAAQMQAFVSPLNAQGKVSDKFDDERYGVATYYSGTTVIPFSAALESARLSTG